MITSKLIKPPVEIKHPTPPFLLENKKHGFIVLINEARIDGLAGTVIVDDDIFYGVGYYNSKWDGIKSGLWNVITNAKITVEVLPS